MLVMKFHFNIVLDTRDDGTRVFTAKCLRCDAVIVGEVNTNIPVVQATTHVPPQAIPTLNRQVRAGWIDAKKNGVPFVIPNPDFEVITLPDHGLQVALDAHVDVCIQKTSTKS